MPGLLLGLVVAERAIGRLGGGGGGGGGLS